MRRTVLVAVILTTFCSMSVADGYLERIEYISMISGGIDGGWHGKCVSKDQVTLAQSDPSWPCHVKAYGWKLLDSWREKGSGDPWWSRGRLKQKWGWKMVIRNSGEVPFRFHADVRLVSDDDFILSSDSLGGPESSDPYWLKSGETKLFAGAATYDVQEHRGEGDASHITWNVRVD